LNNAQTGYAEVNGARIYYETAGAGHPLVLVHAGIADSRMWDGQFNALAEHYRVIRYDLRGYGKTAMVTGDFAHHEDLGGLLDFLNIERAYLVGCSMGGRTIIDFTLEHPEKVRALIPVGADLSGYEDKSEPPKQWDEMVAAYEQGDFERLSELEVQIWVDGRARNPQEVNPTVRTLVREMNTIALQNAAQKLGSEVTLDPPAIGRLTQISVPALIVAGDLDQQHMLEIANLLANGIPGAQKVVMGGTAHVPNMEQPSEFNRLVVDFLAKLPETI
jgi:pimeloyl-ACP methyl ester carboxylesterase